MQSGRNSFLGRRGAWPRRRARCAITRSRLTEQASAAALLCLIAGSAPALADPLSQIFPTTQPFLIFGDGAAGHGDMSNANDHDAGHMLMDRVPAGVHGAQMPDAGVLMLGYAPTFMHMEQNYIGSSAVSPAVIAATIYSGQNMTTTKTGMGGMGTMTMTMPVMMRVVPSSMDSQMHDFHAVLGLTDRIDLTFMASYVQKSMSMTTFAGMSGIGVLGQSSGVTQGFGDAMVGAEYRLYQDKVHHLHVELNLSIPTGRDTQQIQMLSPMGYYMWMRAPYAMQIGTGTVDLAPSLAYMGSLGPWSWGMIYRGRFPLDYNAQGYQYGALNEVSGWGGFTLLPGVTVTGRTLFSTQDHIHGLDPNISSMAQTANPLYYGGKRVELLGGLVISGAPWGFHKAAIAVEAGGPVFQELNGPQLGAAWRISVAGRVMF